MPAPVSRAPEVWLIQDRKPGHISQLRGLGNRLRVLAGANVSNIDAAQVKVPLWRALLGLAPAFDAPKNQPDLIIAAGHGTHRLLLSLRRRKRAKTVVLMKPGFPLSWVSAAIIPAHDTLRAQTDNRRVLVTEGVINAVTPLAKITDKPEALILVGGPSDHFQWDDDVVLGQINELMGHYPQWRWTISASRRTPDSLVSQLKELANLKVTVIDHTRTHQSWLPHQLSASRAAWVTPDSASMVCEAATSGVPTGIFELTARPGSRVDVGIRRLVDQGHIMSLADHASVMAGSTNGNKQLWEADRAARWLIANLMPGKRP